MDDTQYWILRKRQVIQYSCLFAILISLVSCSSSDDSHTEEKHVDLGVNETIPVIEIKVTDLAYPKIFEGSYLEGTVVNQDGEKMTFLKKDIGQLSITSGKIIATDPIVLHDATPYVHDFPKGLFPVELAIIKIGNDKRIGFSRIKFNDSSISRWEFALKEGQEKIPITSSEIIGYGVDGGTGMFIDEDGAKYLNSLDFDDYWEEIFVTKFSEKWKPTWSYLNYEFNGKNLVAFSTGYGDGYYGTYVGYDEDGNISQLLTDFGIISWWIKEGK